MSSVAAHGASSDAARGARADEAHGASSDTASSDAAHGDSSGSLRCGFLPPFALVDPRGSRILLDWAAPLQEVVRPFCGRSGGSSEH